MEVILTVAIIGLITGISAPVYYNFQSRNELDISAMDFATNFRRAQLLARASSGDSNWGVYYAGNNIILYKGSNYAAREVGLDELTAVAPQLTVGGMSDINFSKYYGLPNAPITVTITSNNNESRTVILNEKGSIEY